MRIRRGDARQEEGEIKYFERLCQIGGFFIVMCDVWF